MRVWWYNDQYERIAFFALQRFWKIRNEIKNNSTISTPKSKRLGRGNCRTGREESAGMEDRERLIQLKENSGMNWKEFAEYFEIPYRTMQDWEHGKRTMPHYLLRLMEYKLRTESCIRKGAHKSED